MEIYQLKYLKAVVEHQSYSKAAEALYVTQPSVSVAIRKLEQAYNVSLLRREGQKVTLTEAGEKIYPSCLKLLRDYEKLNREFEECNSLLKKNIRIYVPYSLYSRFILFVMANLRTEFPNVNFLVDQCGLNLQKENLEKMDFDFLICSSLDVIEASDMACIDFATMEYFVHISADSPLAQYEKLLPFQLVGEKILSSRFGVGMIFERYFQKQGVYLDFYGSSYPPDALMNLVSNHVGVAIMPKQSTSIPNVVRRPLSPSLTDRLVLICRESAPKGEMRQIIKKLTEFDISV